MSTVENARAIEAALQRLQGPAATGKLLVKATGADVQIGPGRCAVPVDGGAFDARGTVFVKANANDQEGCWTVTSAGVLVDVEAIQGGTPGNRGGGMSYRWDPPIDGVELQSPADGVGLTGGDWSGAFAGLRQVSHFRTLAFDGRRSLFQSNTFDYPAIVIAWGNTTPLDGTYASAPGPRTARVSSGRMLYAHSWFLWIATSRLDSGKHRRDEADYLRQDVLEVLQFSRRVRERAFFVSVEPGAEIAESGPQEATGSYYVDRVTLRTITTLEHRPGPPDFAPWLRTRLKMQLPPQPPDPELDLVNAIVPMPPDGPGPGPFP